ncbi:hypothetical protein [Aestuariivirga sp.]|uniref:hypothetical protein n=1 Tax=Aestuariivirga sp. TaxID=2650926 RepID=UPI00359467EB
MDATALLESLDTAKAAELALLERLGQALAAGDEDKVMSLQRELRDAEATTAELDRAVSAIDAATQAAERTRIEREKREAAEARASLLADARADHANLVKIAAKIDKAQAAFDGLLAEMDAAATEFADKYRPLGMNPVNRSWLTAKSWTTEILHYIKNRSHRTLVSALYASGLQTYGAGKPVAKMVPAFERLMVLQPGDGPEHEKEAA